MLSVIIPARNEIYLQRTIQSVLDAAEGDIEVIAIADGYWPNPPVKDDPRVRLLHNTTPRGQRHSINDAAHFALGKYIMKLDGHCSVDKGFDVKLAADCEYDWTVVPTMYNLKVSDYVCKSCGKVKHQPPKPDKCEECGKTEFEEKELWEPNLSKKTNYMYISSPDKEKPFRPQYYEGKEKDDWQRQPQNDKMIDETMCCMGPGWFMHKKRFWELGGMDEKHGEWGQMGPEVGLKAWTSGGSLMVNKKTWFAHWFRGGGGPGFPYPASGKAHERAREYSRDLWLNNKWEGQKRSLEWVIEKFNPPGWKSYYAKKKGTRMFNLDNIDSDLIEENHQAELNSLFYKHIHRKKNSPVYRGITLLKMPSDMALYMEVIHDKKPDFIVEVGTKYGASALFFQDQLDLTGKGKVITIDIKDNVETKDPRITYLIGDSKSDKIIDQVKKLVSGSVMVVLDGDHRRAQVKWELKKYRDIVTSNQYLVVEDCYIDRGLYGPGQARDWFLKNFEGFENTQIDKKYLVGMNIGAWLLKKGSK